MTIDVLKHERLTPRNPPFFPFDSPVCLDNNRNSLEEAFDGLDDDEEEEENQDQSRGISIEPDEEEDPEEEEGAEPSYGVSKACHVL